MAHKRRFVPDEVSVLYVARNYEWAVVLVLLGICMVADGASEGVYLVAGGVIFAILTRALAFTRRSS